MELASENSELSFSPDRLDAWCASFETTEMAEMRDRELTVSQGLREMPNTDDWRDALEGG